MLSSVWIEGVYMLMQSQPKFAQLLVISVNKFHLVMTEVMPSTVTVEMQHEYKPLFSMKYIRRWW